MANVEYKAHCYCLACKTTRLNTFYHKDIPEGPIECTLCKKREAYPLFRNVFTQEGQFQVILDLLKRVRELELDLNQVRDELDDRP